MEICRVRKETQSLVIDLMHCGMRDMKDNIKEIMKMCKLKWIKRAQKNFV